MLCTGGPMIYRLKKNRIKVTALHPPFVLTVDGKQQQQTWRLKKRVSLKDVLIASLESDNEESVLEIDSHDFLNEDSLEKINFSQLINNFYEEQALFIVSLLPCCRQPQQTVYQFL